MISLADISQSPLTSSSVVSLVATVDSALCVGAGGSSGSLADKPILKTAEGRLVIPASQLKGRLRHECEKLLRGLQWPVCESPSATLMCPQRAGIAESERFRLHAYRLRDFATYADGEPQHHCLICQLFGNPALPGRIRFSDLVCIDPPDAIPEVIRPGVTINRRRRTAEDQKLYFLETSPANAELKFKGSIEMLPPWPFLDGQERPDFAMALLRAGLAHIHALGGSKSAGLGWLTWSWAEGEPEAIDDAVWDFLGSAQGQDKEETA